ncbi:MAG TPA: transposase [Lacipirellulaceae bacterium]|nr:transposase [Lacipirellulaceae bacterium]
MSTRIIHRRNYNIAGLAHELTFCCYQRLALLKSPRTCEWLCGALNQARREFDFDLWAYVFMPDHVHLIVHPRRPKYDIAEIRKAIKYPTSKIALAWLREHRPDWLIRLTRRRGPRIETHFWQLGGGYDRNIDNGATLIEMMEYVHLNPVRKGLVVLQEDWEWSSAGHYLGRPNQHLPVDPIPPHCLDGA